MPEFFLNGRFLARPVTGVERFATMLLDHVHAGIDRNYADWTILAPTGTPRPERWPNFGFRTGGRLKGHPWEQLELPWMARGGLLVNLCNAGPVAHRNALTMLHDAAVYDFPANFARSYRLMHQTLGRLLARRSTIGTVSHFSRGRLASVFGLDPMAIPIVPNAADHVDDVAPDPTIVPRLGLIPNGFLLFVGSFAPNKNLTRAMAAFSQMRQPEDRLVLVGAAVKSFAANGMPDVPEGVVLPGRITDEELVGLMRQARCLVFPSLYEGFGIPPLEAMRLNCPVIAADISPLREVCGDAALFHDPRSTEDLAGAMRRMLDDDALHARLVERSVIRSRHYSWKHSAEALLDAIEALV